MDGFRGKEEVEGVETFVGKKEVSSIKYQGARRWSWGCLFPKFLPKKGCSFPFFCVTLLP